MIENADSARDARPLFTDSLFRLLVFLCLLTFAAGLECRSLSAFRDPEIWGHMRAGTWILQNKSWPESGVFSQSVNQPWRDFSWGFDVVVAIGYRLAGYASLPALLIVLRVGLALCTFLLAGGWRSFWAAAALSVLALFVLLPTGPGPAFVSVLLFAWEASVLWRARETGNVRRLLWLPFLFVVWVNVDLGFVYGIGLYVLFLIALWIEMRFPTENRAVLDCAATNIPFPHAVWIGAACVAASCLNPYGVHPYGAFLANEFSPVNRHLPGYNAMGFRQPQDYLLMLLGMGAFLALGLLRSRDPFQLGALAACTALSFHAQRENWLLTLVAVAVIGQAIRRMKLSSVLPDSRWNAGRLAALAAAIVLPLGIFFLGEGRNQNLLFLRIAEHFPVAAGDFLRQKPQAAPLFNDYEWGAFLTWYLPEYSVAVDSRRGLYPEETELGYFKAMNADISYREYPPMNQARTFLLDKSSVMGQALRGASGFHVLYEDNLAIVYSHESEEQP